LEANNLIIILVFMDRKEIKERKHCLECGNEITNISYSKRFCSKKCNKEYRKVSFWQVILDFLSI